MSKVSKQGCGICGAGNSFLHFWPISVLCFVGRSVVPNFLICFGFASNVFSTVESRCLQEVRVDITSIVAPGSRFWVSVAPSKRFASRYHSSDLMAEIWQADL